MSGVTAMMKSSLALPSHAASMSLTAAAAAASASASRALGSQLPAAKHSLTVISAPFTNAEAVSCAVRMQSFWLEKASAHTAPCGPPRGDGGVPVPSSEDVDSYANGMPLVGVNGWGGWDDNPGVIATVTNAQSRSAPHSVLIDSIPSDDDAVQQYVGAYCADET